MDGEGWLKVGVVCGMDSLTLASIVAKVCGIALLRQGRGEGRQEFPKKGC